MPDIFLIDGVEYITTRSAARRTGYSSDHIARLARSGAILARREDRQWYVSLHSLREFTTKIEQEEQRRREELRELRKQELARQSILREDNTNNHKVSPPVPGRLLALVETIAVLFVGVMVGTTGFFIHERSVTVRPADSFASLDRFALAWYDLVSLRADTMAPHPTRASTLTAQVTESQALNDTPPPSHGTDSELSAPEAFVYGTFSDSVTLYIDETSTSTSFVVGYKPQNGDERRFHLVSEVEDGETVFQIEPEIIEP